MKASELRFGNYVTANEQSMWKQLIGEPLKVVVLESRIDKHFPESDSVIGFMHGNEWYSQFNEFIEPIPLTEEWLLKFGFGSKSRSACTMWSLNGIHLTHEHEDEYGEPDEHYDQFLYDYRFEIKYVHQLQNIYFALTGEELNIYE